MAIVVYKSKTGFHTIWSTWRAVCTSSKLLCTSHFYSCGWRCLWQKCLALVNQTKVIVTGKPKCKVWELLRPCLHVVGPLVPFRKNFDTLSKQEPWYTLGTLWEHPICQAWWIMHYITLWENMFMNPRLVYRNNKTQNTKGILSQHSFFMIVQCPSCLGSMRSYAIGCCHCVWWPVEANFSN
jgi:hypothetical protein